MGHRVNVLLDTHALLWWLQGGAEISRRARNVIQASENNVVVSAATAWEMAIKSQQGRLSAGPLLADFGAELAQEGFGELPIVSQHAIRAGLLPSRHKDPFDRMLIAQAQSENLTIVSRDVRLDGYGVRRIW
jgi:PIN domain nuclease of toxin-antitoxin system